MQQCCIASCDCLSAVLPPPWATNFPVPVVYFLKHENLLRTEVVIHAIVTTNNHNLLSDATFLHNKLQENVARITWPSYRI